MRLEFLRLCLCCSGPSAAAGSHRLLAVFFKMLSPWLVPILNIPAEVLLPVHARRSQWQGRLRARDTCELRANWVENAILGLGSRSHLSLIACTLARRYHQDSRSKRTKVPQAAGTQVAAAPFSHAA